MAAASSAAAKSTRKLVEFGNYFAQRGFVVFSMDYRLLFDYPPAPEDFNVSDVFPIKGAISQAVHAAMVDVKAAVRYIRANAEEYGVDPDKIAVLGESAGGGGECGHGGDRF